MPILPNHADEGIDEIFDTGEALAVVRRCWGADGRLILRLSDLFYKSEMEQIGSGGFALTNNLPALTKIINDAQDEKPLPQRFKDAVDSLLAHFKPYIITAGNFASLHALVIFNKDYVQEPPKSQPLEVKSFDFTNYQAGAMTTANYPHDIALPYVVMGLAGEAGEIANKVKKIYRDNKGLIDLTVKQALAEEAGDVLWYVAQLCTELGITLEDVAKGNLNKLQQRKKNGTIGGSGDNR